VRERKTGLHSYNTARSRLVNEAEYETAIASYIGCCVISD